MENNNGEWEKMKKEINEVMSQGRDYANQLKSQLSSSSSQESRQDLANKILQSYHKSLSIMSMNSGELDQDSPSSQGCDRISPKSDDSDHDQPHIKSSKKSMPRWTKKVRITPGAGTEGTLDDGFSWRKYGQKDILGAKFPRGYYRCTHRKSQRCEATKQVQRSSEDPMEFEIIYRGTHSCSQVANVGSTIPIQTLEPNQTQELENMRNDLQIEKDQDIGQHNFNNQSQVHQAFQYFPSSTSNLESNNAYLLQSSDHNIDIFGSRSSEINYNFSISQDIDSTSPSTSISPSTVALESSYQNFNPNYPFGSFGGFYQGN